MSPLTYAGAGVALAAAIALGYQHWQIGRLEDRVLALEREKAAETQARGQWQAAADNCSKSLGQIQARGRAARRAYEASLASAHQQTAALQDRARAILSAPRAEGLDECQATRAELDAEVDRRHQP